MCGAKLHAQTMHVAGWGFRSEVTLLYHGNVNLQVKAYKLMMMAHAASVWHIDRLACKRYTVMTSVMIY